MHVLVLTPQLPYPPHQGTTIRNYNLLAGLARHHQVAMLSFLGPGDDLSQATPLTDLCEATYTFPQPRRSTRQRLWNTFTSPWPDMAHRLATPAFGRKLLRLLRAHSVDVIQFEGIEMIPYLRTLISHRDVLGGLPRLVFDDHNAEHVLQRRFLQTDLRTPARWPLALYSLIQWQKLKRYEAWACRQVDAVIAVSDEDADALQRIVPGLQVTVVPNGVDISIYAAFSGPKAALGPHNLVFTGTMDFRPNVDAAIWFCRRVLPRIQRHVPSARFYIVGQRPHPRVLELQNQPGVEVTGAVPDQMPYIGGATVFVIPMRGGGGTRLKVLEAMAMRRAIVSTSMGCSGFPVAHGSEVLLADGETAFAQEVVGLLQNPARREALGEAAFSFARRYDWRAIVPRLEAAFEAKPTP